MAFHPAAQSARHRADAVRRLGDMDGGVLENPKQCFDSGRIRLHGALSSGGRNLHPLRAWIILGIAAPTTTAGAAAFAAILTRGH